MSLEPHTRAYEVTLTVHLVANANVNTVHDLIADLEWVGGCREYGVDPAFHSLTTSEVRVKRQKLKDKKP